MSFPVHQSKDTRFSSSLGKERLIELKEFAKKIRVSFKDYSLLHLALTHPSYGNEFGGGGDNQRLEYLGDSVLGFVINDYLYKRFANYNEGELSKIKSAVVSEAALARVAFKIDLGSCLCMGRGETNNGGRERPSNLADAFEALIAALYLDRGIEDAREFIIRNLKPSVDNHLKPGKVQDPKSMLQEMIQRGGDKRPSYELLSESGPKHSLTFVCRVMLGEEELGVGSGSSLKKAERRAAENALRKMGL